MTLFHPRASPIDRYLAGELAPAAEAKLRAHLRGCDRCRAHYDEGVELLRAARAGGWAPGERQRLIELANAPAGIERPRTPGLRPPLFPWALAAVAAVAIAGLFALITRAPAVGIVVARRGEVRIDGRVAEPGQPVPAGALITSPVGETLVRLDNGAEALLREGTAVRFASGGAVVRLSYGRARFQVQRPGGAANPFAVELAVSRVEVEGTIFAVERRDGGEELVAVHEGKVRVRARNTEVSLTSGMETTVSGGTIAAPRPAARRSLEEDRGGFDLLRWLEGEGGKAIKWWQRVLRR